MTTDTKSPVADSAELSAGDQIHVWHQGRLIHTGTVTDTMPTMNLFWIQKEGYGGRRLFDMNEFAVTRAPQAK